jgi:BlaI family transcriptional regulator, penicillinase repressor
MADTMSKPPRISDLEWEVMKVLWAESPLTAVAVIEKLQAQDASWHPQTARTLLHRLTRKGALAFQQAGLAYLYSPACTEAECAAAASESFLDRVFGGSLAPMLAHVVQHRKLSRKEIEQLKRILDGKEP